MVGATLMYINVLAVLAVTQFSCLCCETLRPEWIGHHWTHSYVTSCIYVSHHSRHINLMRAHFGVGSATVKVITCDSVM